MTGVELNLWMMPVRRRSVRRALEKIIKPFHQKHPKISVRILVIPWSTVWDRLMSGLKGRHGAFAPDVLQIDLAWTGTLAALGLIRKIPPPETDDVLPALRDACRMPGQAALFAEPWTLDLRVIKYRRDAVEETGLPEDALSTWDGLRELMRRAAALRRPLFRPRPGGEGLLAELAPWVWAGGGAFFSEDRRRPAFLSGEALSGVSFYRDLMTVSSDGRGEPLLETDSAGPVWPSKTGAVPPPRGPAGRFTVPSGNALALAAGGRHPEESALLIRHLTTPESRRLFAEEAGLLPPSAPVFPLAVESLAWARPFPSMVLLGAFERLFSRRLSPLLRSGAPWEAWRAAIERTAQETEILLSHYDPSDS